MAVSLTFHFSWSSTTPASSSVTETSCPLIRTTCVSCRLRSRAWRGRNNASRDKYRFSTLNEIAAPQTPEASATRHRRDRGLGPDEAATELTDGDGDELVPTLSDCRDQSGLGGADRGTAIEQ